MVLRVHLFDDTDKDTILVKYEGAAKSADRDLAAHLLLSPCPEILKHLGGSVRKQGERKGELVNELSV